MLISSVLVGLALALMRRGDLRGLAVLRLRWWWLIVLAFGLKYLAVRMAAGSPWLLEYGSLLHIVVYGLLLTPLVANIGLPGMGLIAAGTALNGVAIIANGGRMPVSETALLTLGKTATLEALHNGRVVTHALVSDQTWFAFLGDWIPLPPPWSAAVSLGDFVLAAGVIWLITAAAAPRQPAPVASVPQEGR